jgi:hypothetical protein
MNFAQWLDTLVEEKGIDPEMLIEVEGPSGTNIMPLEVVLDAMKATTPGEQAAIKNMIVRIDFANGDVVDYLKHLAQAIAL